ncbi:hypothetical protein BCON_0325g00020 [Botryotinia convoluta]|uniref:Uncharacterized protein n=1 Tax=Botryotinia convoluta TaxID=54673 RepID=A0A4Z1HBI9_9HELO|nr:hypothetical protein BCON_0325g00020 [Botryotinia convoluta]
MQFPSAAFECASFDALQETFAYVFESLARYQYYQDGEGSDGKIPKATYIQHIGLHSANHGSPQKNKNGRGSPTENYQMSFAWIQRIWPGFDLEPSTPMVAEAELLLRTNTSKIGEVKGKIQEVGGYASDKTMAVVRERIAYAEAQIRGSQWERWYARAYWWTLPMCCQFFQSSVMANRHHRHEDGGMEFYRTIFPGELPRKVTLWGQATVGVFGTPRTSRLRVQNHKEIWLQMIFCRSEDNDDKIKPALGGKAFRDGLPGGFAQKTI